jgi:hypothetical protein
MSIYKRQGRWIADFYIGGRLGKRVRRVFKLKEHAETFERNEKLKEFKGEIGAKHVSDICLKPFIEKYRELHSPTKSPSSRNRDEYTISHILKFFGNPLLKQLSVESIESYKALRAKKVQITTVNKELDLLKSVLNRAVDWGYLRVNPATMVKKFKENVKEPIFLNQSEGSRLIGTWISKRDDEPVVWQRAAGSVLDEDVYGVEQWKCRPVRYRYHVFGRSVCCLYEFLYGIWRREPGRDGDVYSGFYG